MRIRVLNSSFVAYAAAYACLVLAPARTEAQATTPAPSPASPAHSRLAPKATEVTVPHPGQTQAEATETKASEGTLVDQVVAIVNGDLVLESDVDEERRFMAFQPYRGPEETFPRQQAVERLIDRTLILQQAKAEPDADVTSAEAKTQLETLRRDIPACKQYHCETTAGWTNFVHDQGFTVDALTERWRQRMQVLKFIEARFRMGIRIAPQEIQDYYSKTLLPEYAKQKATPPGVDAIRDRIQEVLLQKQVSNLLGDWLKTLRAEGTVRVMTADEVAP